MAKLVEPPNSWTALRGVVALCVALLWAMGPHAADSQPAETFQLPYELLEMEVDDSPPPDCPFWGRIGPRSLWGPLRRGGGESGC